MKSTTLHALVIDHHLGELPPEVEELLLHHLATNPGARAEAEHILAALQTTQETVIAFPELAQPSPEVTAPTLLSPKNRAPWLRRVAIAALFAAATSGAYFAGKFSIGTANETVSSPPKTSPWARYRMTPASNGSGMTVVRVDRSGNENIPIQ